jgi:hypothetical protein
MKADRAISSNHWVQATPVYLAACYFNRFCPLCGMVEEVSDKGDRWTARVFTGYIGIHNGDIRITKIDGLISWENGPTITNWNQLWE